MQTDVSFTWWRERNRRDYIEIMPEAFRPMPSFVDVAVNDRVPRIVAQGVCLEPYQPLKEFPDLYERFARLRTQREAVEFVRAFGPLTEEGLKGGKGDSLYMVLRRAEAMAQGNLHVGFVVCSLNARLVAGHDGISLQVEPANLDDALWFQFAQAAANGLANRCRQCNSLFATGPDAMRRRGAEFCSVECKTKFHSLKRSRSP
jgi:hypothetical protein